MILTMMVFILPINVQADSFTLNVVADKTSVKPGETVELTLQLANIDAGNLGINTLECTLEYDKNIFEEVEQSNMQSLNNWSLTYNSEDDSQNGKLLAVIITDGVTEDQNIGKIMLKVKNGVEYSSTTIKITQIASNNGQEIIQESDKQVVLEVGNKPEEQDPNDQENNGNGGNGSSDNDRDDQTGNDNQGNGNQGNSSQGNNGNKGQNDDISPDIIPQAGMVGGIIIFIVAVILIVVAIISFIQYKNIER